VATNARNRTPEGGGKEGVAAVSFFSEHQKETARKGRNAAVSLESNGNDALFSTRKGGGGKRKSSFTLSPGTQQSKEEGGGAFSLLSTITKKKERSVSWKIMGGREKRG